MTEADLVPLAHATVDAFDATLSALLRRDKHAARGALRGSVARRLLVSTTKEALRSAPSTLPPAARADQLKLVADLDRICQVVDHLARRVLEDRDGDLLGPTARLDVAALLDAGGCRLRGLADGTDHVALRPGPRSGTALAAVVDHASRDRSMTMRLCAALALMVLQASRHAARAA